MDDKSLVGTKIKAVPNNEQQNIGIDTEDTLAKNILEAAINKTLSIEDLDNFFNVAQSRESIYQLIDIMSQDNTVSSILECYAEDATETNNDGDVMWVESEDTNCVKYISFLLNSLQINKNAYSWVYQLIKYGDLYLKLFKHSDIEDPLFDNKASNDKQALNEKMSLNEAQLKEDVILKMQESDHYVTFAEDVKNPGEMFELTKFGKSYGFIKAPYNVFNIFTGQDAVEQNAFDYYRYKVDKNDIEIFSATNFVHGVLEDNTGRVEEKVSIYNSKVELEKDDAASLDYSVRRGKSILYDWFKSWREMTLLENSIILNRLTKSSVVRIIQVEVGDMPKEMVASHLQGIKSMMEQKSAIDTGNNMSNYTNPGPVANNIYVPTHGGLGNISVGSVGGDYDPKELTDLEYFRDRFFSGTGVPKQFLNWTDDGAGFNGGASLTLISSKYAKRIKRIQQAFISAITDLVNILLWDRGLNTYIGNFKLRMQEPITQESVDRRDSQSNALGVMKDTLDVLSDISDVSTRLKIIKSLLKNITSDPDILTYIQDEIDRLEQEGEVEEQDEERETSDVNVTVNNRPSREQSSMDIGNRIFGNEETNEPSVETSEEPSESSEDNYLPSFAEMGVDSNDIEI